MPEQIVPISNLAEVGLIKDYPPVALPPNAFTEALNVRFRHGAAAKMEGERAVLKMTPTQLGYPTGEFVFVTEWSNPNLGDDNTYYIAVVEDSGTDHVMLFRAFALNLDSPQSTEVGSVPSGGRWQSTLFQGGFAIILNNGRERPFYLLDSGSGIAFENFEMHELPGWDSYQTFESVLDITVNDAAAATSHSLGRVIDFAVNELFVEAYDNNGALVWDAVASSNGVVQNNLVDAFTVSTDVATDSTIITPEYTGINALLDDYTLKVYERSIDTVDVRAGIIKSYGDFLIAGDLRIIDPNDDSVRKQLPGLVRTSSIAGPGALPSNWNPYAIGNNTADEIQLASTGTVKDMVPLQNGMMIYTNKSIHALQVTNNPAVPFTVTNITDSYGAMTLDSVIEFNGRHMVIGNNDIYLFGGHPGSIESVAEGKVRDFFYRDINLDYITNLFLIRNASKDEIWINYPSGNNEYADKTLIWNYRANTWTIRQMSEMRSGFAGRAALISILDGGDADDILIENVEGNGASQPTVTGHVDADDATPDAFDPARRYPIFCSSDQVYLAEADESFTRYDDTTYESKVARTEMPMTPEFDSETMHSLALWSTRGQEAQDIDLHVYVKTHNNPTGDQVRICDCSHRTFTIGKDYKVDIRQTGRFFNYVVSDKPTDEYEGTSESWKLSGLQAKIGKRGER